MPNIFSFWKPQDVTPTPTSTPTSTPTPTLTTTPGIYSGLFSTGSTGSEACSNTPNITLYSNQPIFTLNQKLYYDSGLTNVYLGSSGVYYVAYNGTSAYVVWFGGGTIGDIQTCATPTPTPTRTPTPTPTLTPTPGIYSGLFCTGSTQIIACGCENAPVTLYSTQPFFTNGQLVYTNNSLTNYVPFNTYISSGGTSALIVWYNGYLGSIGSCPTPTPTPTRTPTPTVTSTPTPTPTQTLTPTPSSTPGLWTPALLSGIYDWWSSDTGVDVSGDNVISWEGYYGTFLVPNDTTFNTIIYEASDPDWNGEPSLILNRGNIDASFFFEGQASGLNTDKTLILVSKVFDFPSGGRILPLHSLGRTTISPYTYLALNKDANNWYGFNNQPNQPTYFGSFSFGDYSFSMMTYNRSNGEYKYYSSRDSGIVNQNFAEITGLPEVNYGGGSLLIGKSAESGQYTPQMTVVEFIAIDSLMSIDELDLLKNYFNLKYGL